MTGYSGTPLAKKLGIAAGARLLRTALSAMRSGLKLVIRRTRRTRERS